MKGGSRYLTVKRGKAAELDTAEAAIYIFRQCPNREISLYACMLAYRNTISPSIHWRLPQDGGHCAIILDSMR